MTKETCWTLIQAANGGDPRAQEGFAERYLPPVKAYLRARWRNGPLISECDDAVQEVFVRCFADSSPLSRISRTDQGGFRAFLYGICRNVAREFEQKRVRHAEPADIAMHDVEKEDSRLTKIFDRAFARQVMKEARDLFEARSHAEGEEATKRFELLSLRFEKNLPIRDIARRWQADPAKLHKDYARARREYRQALLDIVAEHEPGASSSVVEDTAKHLLDIVG